jgi:4-hydroxy-3-methylbut-2-enyl diphosphate reductase
MKIEKAEKLGLCFGVKRAIKLLKKAANKYGEIETLGPLAHNRLLVEALANLGIKPINHPDQAQGGILAITTHGTSPAILSEIKARHIHVIDTTCPIVRKAQITAKELAEAGFDVIIFGDAEHSEVKGLLGWTGDRGIAALNIQQIDMSVKSPSRLGIISQTTQTQSAFTEFVRQLIGMIGPKIEEMRLVNTLCKVTQGQQEAAIRLARKSQIMIGITAGASTPDEAVEELISKLKSL